MSFDLFFYKKKGTAPTKERIAVYLANEMPLSSHHSEHQWWYQNNDTGVYCCFEYNDPQEEDLDFEGFENTGYQFNINYLRPDFFGKEAFPLVEKFVNDLELYVVNPQIGAEADHPHRPSPGALYNGWSAFNLSTCSEHYTEMDGSYHPLDRSGKDWQYNYQRMALQQKLGDAYFVPRLFFFKTKATSQVITVAVWPQHLPVVVPPADFFLLVRERRKLFRKIKEEGLVSRNVLLEKFGSYMDDFDAEGCRIIHPAGAAKAKALFYDIQFEHLVNDFAEAVEMEKLYNSRPAQ